jgi:hypothetical protein
MLFQPKTEAEVTKVKLLTPGQCDFEVKQAQSVQSKSSGAEMIKLTLEVFDSKGESGIVFDYLLEAMPHKLRHFAYAVGLGHVYEEGEFDPDVLQGKAGRCIIRTEQDKMKEYPAKNAVADYVVAESTKKSGNYAESRTGGAGAVGLERSRKAAWDTYQAKHSNMSADGVKTAFRQACEEYFQTKDSKSVTADQWTQFVKDGFAIPVPSPVSDGPEFKDEDIPF